MAIRAIWAPQPVGQQIGRFSHLTHLLVNRESCVRKPMCRPEANRSCEFLADSACRPESLRIDACNSWAVLLMRALHSAADPLAGVSLDDNLPRCLDCLLSADRSCFISVCVTEKSSPKPICLAIHPHAKRTV
jgi:hypothetical protein